MPKPHWVPRQQPRKPVPYAEASGWSAAVSLRAASRTNSSWYLLSCCTASPQAAWQKARQAASSPAAPAGCRTGSPGVRAPGCVAPRLRGCTLLRWEQAAASSWFSSGYSTGSCRAGTCRSSPRMGGSVLPRACGVAPGSGLRNCRAESATYSLLMRSSHRPWANWHSRARRGHLRCRHAEQMLLFVMSGYGCSSCSLWAKVHASPNLHLPAYLQMDAL
mmetsp:Transcript_64218/g.202979  ORF Transcript_64218/g.202979 Transcript_64218/m.202979 type:complete len:219 (-) Transcript_64218:415-1071(-)